MQGNAAFSRARRIATVAILILNITAGPAAAQSSLTGHIVDDQGVAVEMANVQLLHAADSTLAAGTITDSTGAFAVAAITLGNYRLFVSLIGFADYVSEILEFNGLDNVLIDTVVIAQTTYGMDGLAVEARRALYEQKRDRLVINVGNSLTLVGQSALEVLKRSPGEIVSEQSGTVALVGKAGVQVMIDAATTIGGLVGAYTHRWTMDAQNNMLAFRSDAAITRISIANDEINHWRHAMGSVYVNREFRSGSSRRADLDYVYYHDNNPTNYYNTITNLATRDVTEERQSSGKNTPL